MAWWDQTPTVSKCPHCGQEITRKRGNLKGESLRRAIAHLLQRHVAKHHGAAQVNHQEPKVLNWRALADAVPDPNQRCIVRCKNGQIIDAYRDERWLGGFVTNASGTAKRRCGVSVSGVTHWTPYPREFEERQR
jgi:hypothetical protein